MNCPKFPRSGMALHNSEDVFKHQFHFFYSSEHLYYYTYNVPKRANFGQFNWLILKLFYLKTIVAPTFWYKDFRLEMISAINLLLTDIKKSLEYPVYIFYFINLFNNYVRHLSDELHFLIYFIYSIYFVSFDIPFHSFSFWIWKKPPQLRYNCKFSL